MSINKLVDELVKYFKQKRQESERKESERQRQELLAQKPFLKADLKKDVQNILNESIDFHEHNTVAITRCKPCENGSHWNCIAETIIPGKRHFSSSVIVRLNGTSEVYFQELQLKMQDELTQLEVEASISPQPPEILEVARNNIYQRYDFLQHQLVFLGIRSEIEDNNTLVRIAFQFW